MSRGQPPLAGLGKRNRGRDETPRGDLLQQRQLKTYSVPRDGEPQTGPETVHHNDEHRGGCRRDKRQTVSQPHGPGAGRGSSCPRPRPVREHLGPRCRRSRSPSGFGFPRAREQQRPARVGRTCTRA